MAAGSGPEPNAARGEYPVKIPRHVMDGDPIAFTGLESDTGLRDERDILGRILKERGIASG